MPAGGGIVVFKWGRQELTLLQNRDNWAQRVISAADWDDRNQILGGRCALNDGTWFGVSRTGRVAFLVDPGLFFDRRHINDVEGGGAESITIKFLQSRVSPQTFADEIIETERELYSYNDEDGTYDDDSEPEQRGLVYNLIVADLRSSSMYHICKPDRETPHVITNQVTDGVHTLSDQGLDAQDPKDLRLRQRFVANIGDYEQNQIRLWELAERVMFDRRKIVEGDDFSALFVAEQAKHDIPDVDEDGNELERKTQRYGTVSTTAFSVKPTSRAEFWERIFGKQPPHQTLSFDIQN